MNEKHAEELLIVLQKMLKELSSIDSTLKKIAKTQQIIASYTEHPVFREAPHTGHPERAKSF